MNRRNFLKIIGLAPIITTLPAIGSVPLLLQLFEPAPENPFSGERQIITIPFRLILLQDAAEHAIEFPMPCVLQSGANGVAYTAIYSSLSFDVKQNLTLLRGEVDAGKIMDEVFGTKREGRLWTPLPNFGGVKLRTRDSLTLDWQRNPLLSVGV